jgi:phosphorylcholine metabolism protein LicD
MAYDITLEGENLRQAEKLLFNVAKIFEKCGITYSLESGTLLGIRREARLLPWDNDIDLTMMQDQLHKVDKLLQQLKNAGYRVRIRKYLNNSSYAKKGDIQIIKVRTKKLFGLIKGSVCLEIFLKYPKGDNVFWGVADKVLSTPSFYYNSYKKISFNNYDYSIPELTDEYLEFRYGDWQTAKKSWNTFKDDGGFIP